MRIRAAIATLGLALLLAACGDGDPVATADDPATTTTTPASSTSAPPSTDRYEATGTVLESPDHGPQLCLGGVATSLPPQCGGPDLVGWDWAAVEGEESRNGTTWGGFHVVVERRGDDLQLVSAGPPQNPGTEGEAMDSTPPCPEPAGGWESAVADGPGDGLDQIAPVQAYVAEQADAAGLWVHYPVPPAPGTEMADPTDVVLVVRFTGDLDRHERDLRAVWPGALCVAPAEHTTAELQAIVEALAVELQPGFLSGGVDDMRNLVEIDVIFDDGLQQRLDERYGAGVVEVRGQLRPVT